MRTALLLSTALMFAVGFVSVSQAQEPAKKVIQTGGPFKGDPYRLHKFLTSCPDPVVYVQRGGEFLGCGVRTDESRYYTRKVPSSPLDPSK